jgi:hypothetical protein
MARLTTLDRGTAKTDSTISAASEQTGGVGGGNGKLKVAEWSGTLQGILFGEKRSEWGGESRRGGFCGRTGLKIFSTTSNPRNSVLDRSGERMLKRR